MKKKTGKQSIIKIEGVSLDAKWVSSMSREQWAKAGREFFPLIGNSTPTDAQRTEFMNHVYDLAHKKIGTEPKVVAKQAPDKEK